MVDRFAVEAGMEGSQAADVALAVSELATNSLQHGGGMGRLSFWNDGDALVCELRDHGWLEEPDAQPEPPDPTVRTGRGLWLVALLSDELVRQTSSEGTRTRVTFRPTAG
jgi:anti-sigma regulatory factor (Ser/Thr protein kinase)